MSSVLILNANIVNEGKTFTGDVLVRGERIEKIASGLSGEKADKVIDANGAYLMPGVIDDQVHFREPGLTHKAEIYTEAKAAVAGGTTSFMEMPNTKPQTLTQSLLEEKYNRAAEVSLANYSFFMGASNDNLDEVLKTDPERVCGVKVFMGSSTGNMLVDNEQTLRNLFSRVGMLIATHCEDEDIIRKNEAIFREKYGEEVPIHFHPIIRSEEACYLSSSMAAGLAREYGTRLHILHISTARELELFSNAVPLKDKKITSEACIHHLWFDDSYYDEKGTLIKWNPAVKRSEDREAIRQAVINDVIDVVATDHAPHTLAEKHNPYFKAPSGGPMVQHSLVAMLEMAEEGVFTREKVVEKMSHKVAELFRIKDRGYIREGYYADLVLVEKTDGWRVTKDSLLYKCGWSPMEGQAFSHKVTHTLVSGHLAYENGRLDESRQGKRLLFYKN
ncbi:dihydroorotase [Roseivirga sp. BDSF3-8]|uniref:dihydroorotase n=1 Tax=Roseivirga sp. BDSF3-8 TaxID=3241598 RepID=UPI0035323324